MEMGETITFSDGEGSQGGKKKRYAIMRRRNRARRRSQRKGEKIRRKMRDEGRRRWINRERKG